MLGTILDFLRDDVVTPVFQSIGSGLQAIGTGWQWLTWHSTIGAILVPLTAVAAGLVLSRITSKGAIK